MAKRKRAAPQFRPILHLDGLRTPETLPEQRSNFTLRWRELRWTRRVVVALVVVVVAYIFVGEAAVIPTRSMEGTILVGDHILLDKILYGPRIPFTHWRLPQLKPVRRGSIISFRYPRDPRLNFLKRVVGVGGDIVEIHDNAVYVNHLPMNEPYVVHESSPESFRQQSQRLRYPRYTTDMPPLVVPAGQLFVMGDNRENSDDSRNWGTVPLANVNGEPIMIFWSYDAPTEAWLDESPLHQAQFVSSMVANFLSRTRWARTGVLL